MCSCIRYSCLLHITYINNTVIPASGTILSITPHTWWRVPLNSNTSGVRMTRVPYTIMLAFGGSKMELSATRSKVPHHTRSGGHLLISVGAPLESIPQIQNGAKCHAEQSVTPYTWWEPPLGIRGGHLYKPSPKENNPSSHLCRLVLAWQDMLSAHYY